MDKYSPITVARFWSKVDVGKANECWEWTGAKRHYGYGGIKINGVVERSNRVAWELANMAELGDRHALHKCDNPACCNPKHIYAGDMRQNMMDARDRGRLKSKLSHEEAEEIRMHYANGASAWALAADFNVSTPTIHRICARKHWARSRKNQ